jgi:N-acetylmuramoyl-L-alanine amidase
MNGDRKRGPKARCWAAGAMILPLASLAPLAAAFAQAEVETATPVAAACNRADFRIAIDVGHTETNYGAVSARSKHEYEFNRRLARELVNGLWSNGFERAEVVIQTDNDLPHRARDLSSRRPNLMLSLHHDSVQDKYLRTAELDGQMRTFTEGFRGYSIFVSHENAYRDDSDRFAKMLGGEMIAQKLVPTFHHHEQENRPILDKDVGVFQFDGLVVLRQTTAPAVLLESAVITNPEDESKADDPAYRKHITDAIVAAITRFCEVGAMRT